MNQLDVLYRAFADYKRQTQDSGECDFARSAIAAANPESEIIEVIKTICTVDEDWMRAIEEGLTHIEKAINEGRQFIRSSGEVVPIEKVKRVSKDSVEHLSRHSDFITRKPEEGKTDLIPDKLFIVERLSDFAVYENRFLYMLLCYLNSFIALRYNKILDLTNTYRGRAALNKTVAINKRKLTFELKLSDENQDDKYLKENNKLQAIIDKIELLLKAVTHFLSTPLMQEVAKVPMLKPPITKTNVLKMNQNFKGAVALYDFVTAYNKPGYAVEENTERINPFSDEIGAEFAETVMLISFLAYKNGLGLDKDLKKSYELEEERRREAEAEKLNRQLIQLKKRIRESGYDPMEYMHLLEKRNAVLEQDSIELISAKEEIKALLAQTDVLNEKINELGGELEESKKENTLLGFKHSEEIKKLNSEHELKTAEMSALHKAQTDELNARHEAALQSIQESHKAEIKEKSEETERLSRELSTKTKEHTRQLEQMLIEHTQKTNELETHHREEVGKLEALAAKKELECDGLTRDKTIYTARLNAMRKEYNLIGEDEDFTARESFSELERQYKVFKSFFNDEWKKTKKRIKKEIFKSESDEKGK